MLIYLHWRAERSSVWRIANKGPKLKLSSCPCVRTRHQGGDPGFLVLSKFFTWPRAGRGVGLCTRSVEVRVLLPSL